MATAWQTLEEAALTLGISSRTLHRRIARGEFQTRLENNRREVLVTIAEPELPPESAPSEELSAEAGEADMSVTYEQPAEDPSTAGADIQTTMLALHEDRIRRTDLAIMAYQQSVTVSAADARRAHFASRLAWGATATITTALFLAVTWATHRVTKAEAEVEHLTTVVRQLSDTADAKSKQADALRAETESARIAAARVEGQLTATKLQLEQVSQQHAQPANYVSQPAAAPDPTTKPVSLRGRLTGFLTVE